MKRLFLTALAVLLLVAPLELSAKHVVKHHRAQAQTAGCGVGQTPPSTGCGIGDMAVGGALSSTDAIAICQQPGGCPASSTTWQLTKLPLLPNIRSSLSATAPLTYNSSTGAFGCSTFASGAAGCVPASGGGTSNYLRADGTWAPTSGSGGGTVTSVGAGSGLSASPSPIVGAGTISCVNFSSTLVGCVPASGGGTTNFLRADGTWAAPPSGGTTTFTAATGLASAPGTYNPGTQTVTNGSTLSTQLFWEGHTSSCTLNSTCGSTNDSGKLLEATTTGVIFSVPAPGAAGSSTYSFSYGGYPYTLTATSGTIYGCGVSNGSSITIAFDATLIPGSISGSAAWKCSGSNNTTFTQLSWGPGMNLQTSPIPMVGKRGTPVQVAGISCMPGVVVAGTPATIDLYYCPDGSSSLPPSGTGCVKMTSTTSCAAGTAGTGGVTQTLTPASTVIVPNGNTVWAYGSGAGWTSGNVGSSSGVMSLATTP